MWNQIELSRPPASSSKTEYRPDAVSRLASVHPADPAPMMMKSNCGSADCDVLTRCLGSDTRSILLDQDRDCLRRERRIGHAGLECMGAGLQRPARGVLRLGQHEGHAVHIPEYLGPARCA